MLSAAAVFVTSFVVCGLWPVICGLWSVVCGLWSVVCGLWSVVCVCGLRFVVCSFVIIKRNLYFVVALLLTKTLVLALLLCVETIPTTWVAATSDDILAFLGLSTIVEPWEVTPARTGGFDLTHIACTNTIDL